MTKGGMSNILLHITYTPRSVVLKLGAKEISASNKQLLYKQVKE
jgi:hypothetical protein